MLYHRSWCIFCDKMTDHRGIDCMDKDHVRNFVATSSSTLQTKCMSCDAFQDPVYRDYNYCPICGKVL